MLNQSTNILVSTASFDLADLECLSSTFNRQSSSHVNAWLLAHDAQRIAMNNTIEDIGPSLIPFNQIFL